LQAEPLPVMGQHVTCMVVNAWRDGGFSWIAYAGGRRNCAGMKRGI
jgi:hypothetical protein